MTTPSDQSDLLVLHTLRVKGMANQESLADLTGLDPSQVSGALTTGVVSGTVMVKEGRLGTTYRLTPEGKEVAAKMLADSMDPQSIAVAEKVDEAFIPLNDDLKALTTDWQMRDGEPNDHSDAAYDGAVIDRLAAVAASISQVLPQADGPLGRMARYRDRFDSALARVRAGENAAFARPMADSFHDAWMELHQDLLLTLNRERSAADGH